MAIVLVLSSLATVFYNNFVQRARETSVIVYLRYLNKAELEYTFHNDQYAKNFDDLEATGIFPNRIVNNIVRKGKKKRILENYSIKLKVKKKTWSAIAKPVNKSPETRWFYIDETGVVRFENGKKPKKKSPEV